MYQFVKIGQPSFVLRSHFSLCVVFSLEDLVDGEKVPSQAGRKEEAMEKLLKMSAPPTEAHPAQGGLQETPTAEGNFVFKCESRASKFQLKCLGAKE